MASCDYHPSDRCVDQPGWRPERRKWTFLAPGTVEAGAKHLGHVEHVRTRVGQKGDGPPDTGTPQQGEPSPEKAPVLVRQRSESGRVSAFRTACEVLGMHRARARWRPHAPHGGALSPEAPGAAGVEPVEVKALAGRFGHQELVGFGRVGHPRGRAMSCQE